MTGCVLVAVGTGLLVAMADMAAQPAPPRAVRSASRVERPATDPTDARPLRILFLGHDQPRSHHTPALFPLLASPLARRGIQLTHVLTPAEALDPARLAYYDALMIYGNHVEITAEQEKTLLDFVEGGKGLVALHCASYMFRNSEKYIVLVGAQFQRHGTGDFSAEIVEPDHSAVAGVKAFTTWDETYVHTKHNPAGRTVLMERVDHEGREPYTWVRTQGKGRVFYTAFGHDRRTWSNPGFHALVERGVAWAVDERARQSWTKLEMPAITYVDGFNIPNYEKRDPAPKYQLPFTPREAMKFMQTPAEFSFELFASEPDIVRPIFFQFDERGRLWLIETVDYPNEMLDGNPGDDRIRILEDTNGDGRADTFTVFADNLNIPTSLVFANDGVIVSQAPHMLFLKDTNGDDKADVSQILSTGWGTGDTHAEPSNLQYGPDNYIWGVVGYSGFKGEMNGKPMQFLQGAYRFKPDGSHFEFMTGSTNNTWGLGFSETFDVFGSTANNEPSFYMAIPNRHFEGVNGLPASSRGVGQGYQGIAAFYQAHAMTPYIRQVDVHGGYTSAAGHNLYTARAFPREYWNRIALITEPTVHIVGQGIVEKQGAGFVTRDGWNLIASSEEWFAPVHAQVGPDGAVWIADWYNFIVQHNPTPAGYSSGRGNAYETALRDDRRGRIYRVAYKKAPAAPRRSLSKRDPAGLLAALESDNMFWRLHAQRLLVERGQRDVVPQLGAIVKNVSVDAIGLSGPALHALWTLQGLGEIDEPENEGFRVAVAALKHPAAGVRKAAAMVLPKVSQSSKAILDAGALQNGDLHTRLAVTLVLAEMPESAEIAQALYKESQKPENFGDRWLSRAFFIAATRHQKPFLTAYRSDKNAVAFDALPISLRIGTLKPDWRVPAAKEVASEWTEMQAPGSWESKGLANFDGVVWFTRTVDWPAGPEATTMSLGMIRNVAEVWLNGLSLVPSGPAPPGGRRFNVAHAYELAPGTLRAGSNTITVRIENGRDDGGFLGTPETMVVEGGTSKVSLAGPWRYRVERQTNASTMYSKAGELQAHVAYAAAAGAAEAAATLKPVAPRAPDVVLRLGVLKGQLKFDLNELVFTNTDEMPHNFLLGAPGSLERIGAAADAMTTNPNAMAQQFVPEIAEVLASTRLVDPGQSVTIQFRAPTQEGQYPYVCTFPGHWRIMNGILTVGAGRRSSPSAAR